jgi:hypothetical protein
MAKIMSEAQIVRRIRVWLGLFISGLVLSGLTAFPLERELALLVSIGSHSGMYAWAPVPELMAWLRTVHDALVVTYQQFPFLAYGTDWLAFAHLAIAIAFIGPMRDPVRNKWVLVFGVIACAGFPSTGVCSIAALEFSGLSR